MLSLQQRERRQAWVLLAPMLVAMFLLTAWPLARASGSGVGWWTEVATSARGTRRKPG